MTGFFNEFLRGLKSPAPYLIWVVVTVVLTLIGPFGTYQEMEPLSLAGAWAAIVGACALWGVALRAGLRRWMPALRFWQATLAISLISAASLCVPIRYIFQYLAGTAQAAVPHLLVFFVLIFQVWVGACVVRLALEQPIKRTPTPQETPSRLMARLPPEMHGPIQRLSARDHYLDVYTTVGKAELLMRFSDALIDLDKADGLQVHRSHWVAPSAVARVERDGAKTMLVLVDGASVPVSKRYRDGLQARGIDLDVETDTPSTADRTVAPEPIDT